MIEPLSTFSSVSHSTNWATEAWIHILQKIKSSRRSRTSIGWHNCSLKCFWTKVMESPFWLFSESEFFFRFFLQRGIENGFQMRPDQGLNPFKVSCCTRQAQLQIHCTVITTLLYHKFVTFYCYCLLGFWRASWLFIPETHCLWANGKKWPFILLPGIARMII